LSNQTPELSKDLREFVQLLVAHRVEFVIVGAYARALYGRPRYTKDIDVFVRSSKENAEKLAALIHAFGFSSLCLTASDFYDPDLVVHLGHEPNRIDISTKISGVSFDQVWANRVPAELDGVPVAFISRDDFLINKRASGRLQDLADAEDVEQIGD
jgi:hypothetical protein